jgi:hypothetical protein
MLLLGIQTRTDMRDLEVRSNTGNL